MNTPKLPFIDCDDFESCYYVSDDNIDINELDKNNSMKYPHYIKGDIAYHYSKKYTFFLYYTVLCFVIINIHKKLLVVENLKTLKKF